MNYSERRIGMQYTNLGGHSGCKILLCESDDNDVFVRKISANKDYNQRLKNQENKQKFFCEKKQSVKIPKIINNGYTEEGYYFFDMEYIQGITLAEYIKTVEIGKIRQICETIVTDVMSVSNRGQALGASEKAFVEKVEKLRIELSDENNDVIDMALEIVKQHDWNRFEETSSHGDLTMENIIIKDNQIYYIDFLDSFYDSWLLDMATLLQDSQTMWSYRYLDKIDINTTIRLLLFRDILLDNVIKYDPSLVIEVYYALLFKLVRIYPYVTDKKTYTYLNEKIISIINIIKEKEKCEH